MASCSRLQEKQQLDMEVEVVTDPSERVKKLSRLELYNIMKEFKGKKLEEKIILMEENLVRLTSCPVEERSVSSRSLRFFKTRFKKKWTESHSIEDRFLDKNADWLKATIELPTWSNKPGRPLKTFQELSERSKRRRTKDLRDQVPVDELTFATRVSHGTSGNTDTSKVLKEITATPTRATKIRKIISTAKKDHMTKKYTPQEALALFVEGDFTRRQWELIQGERKYVYPCYSLIQKAKKECYPKEESIKVTETSFEVELQALLDHTALRLIDYLSDVVDTLSEIEKENLILISKCPICDGSHQTQFKQKFVDTLNDDANIFLSSLVPVRLIVFIDGPLYT